VLKYALLGFLNYQPRTGYDLKQVMDQSIQPFWQAKQSQIYRTLKALEADGLVTSHVEEQESRPDRRVYAITDAGRDALAAWLREPVTELSLHKDPLLLKVFFAAGMDKAALLSLLRVQREMRRQQAATYADETRAVIAEYASAPGLADDARLWEATLRFGEQFEAMYIRWLDETIALIEKEL
jgi:PadR family transcriptional regulator AphA